jgi:hypothetical protein
MRTVVGFKYWNIQRQGENVDWSGTGDECKNLVKIITESFAILKWQNMALRFKIILQGNKNGSPLFQQCCEPLFVFFVCVKIFDCKHVLWTQQGNINIVWKRLLSAVWSSRLCFLQALGLMRFDETLFFLEISSSFHICNNVTKKAYAYYETHGIICLNFCLLRILHFEDISEAHSTGESVNECGFFITQTSLRIPSLQAPFQWTCLVTR